MVREIITESKEVILIHRYNSLDDTFVQYYKPKGLTTVYKNIWVPKDNTEIYETKRVVLTEEEYAFANLGNDNAKPYELYLEGE